MDITPDIILAIIVILFVANFLLSQIINYLNDRNNRLDIPNELKDVYNKDEHQKSMAYNHDNYLFERLFSSFEFVLLLAIVLLGWFASLEQYILLHFSNNIVVAILFWGSLLLVQQIISFPISYYLTFVIEAKYGFNKSTLNTFISDKIKTLLLITIIGGIIISGLIWSLDFLGSNFWLLFWVFFVAISIFISEFYTVLIVPLFNKLTPLEKGELKSAVEDFAKKVDFQLDNIFVIDNSRRSSKSNAYFAGLGKKKKIVLFDTLIANHSKEEIVAVLAHEIGHYKHKHTLKGLVTSIISKGILFYLLSFIIFNPMVSVALGGANQVSYNLGILAFSLLITPVSLIIDIFSNIMSRKFEYEADRYVAINYKAEQLINALKKLHKDNLSNINPHPFAVMMEYSHPTLLQRIRALNKFSCL